jgi:hypothetical protein
MKRPYLLLLGAVVVVAVALTILGRMPRRQAAPAGGEAGAPAPVTALALDLRDGMLEPPATRAPKDHRVRLTVTNRGTTPGRLALAGYEDRLVIPEIVPGASWTGEFVADRPGDDFAWMVDGAPAGRFAVTGSHLVEGHR